MLDIKYLYFIILASLAHATAAQVITVLDAETFLPIELAVLVNQEQNHSVVTNTEGQAEISGFSKWDTVIIQLIGYQAKTLPISQMATADHKILMNPSEISLDQVVVSATRWNQSKKDVPAKITTISNSESSFHNVQTAADLLGGSGEVYIQKSQLGGGSPMIRGFSTNRLLYTVDGVRMNTAIFRSGNLHNVISLDPFALEHTEILFGPGSIIYGSDAIGAVMSFQTITPQLSLTSKPLVNGKAALRYASASREKTGHLHLNLGWKKWAFVTSVTATDYDDLRMGKHGPEDYLQSHYVDRRQGQDVILPNDHPRRQRPTGYGQLNLMQKIRFQPSDNWDLQYGWHFSSTTEVPRYDRLLRRDGDTPISALWNYGPQKWMMNHLLVSHQGQTLYDQANLRLAHQFFRESRINRDFNDPVQTTRVEQVHAYSANLDFSKHFSTGNLYYGVESIFNDVSSSASITDIERLWSRGAPTRYPNATWAAHAIYTSYQHHLSSSLKVEGGLRYSMFMLEADFSSNLSFYPLPFHHAEVNNGALNGSLGLVFNPTNKWSLSAQASTGFRSPNVDDIGKIFDSEPGAVVVPNPNLRAEFAYNIEFGVAKIFEDFMKLDLSTFYTWLDDALIRRNYLLEGSDSIYYDGALSRVQAILNAASMKVYGLQAGLEIKLPAGFHFSGRYNWQVGKEAMSDVPDLPSRHATPSFGVAKLTFRAKDLRLQCNLVFNSKVSAEDLPLSERQKDYLYALDENGDPYTPAWYTLNLKGSYQLTDELAINAGIENLTDQRYRPYSSGISAAGLNFILALKAAI